MERVRQLAMKSRRWPALFTDQTMTNAWTLLSQESQNVQSIVTFCQPLDAILGGGVRLGQLTELVGPAASGKTQLCFQLAVDCQIPTVLGGVEGEVLYIDTEGTFMTNRLESIAKALVEHCNRVASTEEEISAARSMSTELIFSRIHYKRCSDLEELLKVAGRLEELVETKKLKLVILDSAAFLFRYRSESDCNKKPIEQIRDQQRLKFFLTRAAVRKKIAVVLTNHMTTRFDESGRGFESAALSVNWGCDCVTRILLKHTDENRWARLIKSSALHNDEDCAQFSITALGVRGSDTPNSPLPALVDIEDLPFGGEDTNYALCDEEALSDQDLFGEEET